MFTNASEKMALDVSEKTRRKFAIIENAPVLSDHYQGAGKKTSMFL